MKTAKKFLSDCRVELEIELAEKDFQKFWAAAVSEFSKMKIDGFRPGKVPEKILLEKIGRDKIFAEAIEKAIDRKFADAVVAENLTVLTRPEIDLKKTEPLVFTAIFETVPEFEIPKLEKIKIPKITAAKISKKEIEEAKKNICEKSARLKKVDRVAKNGDLVECDFTGFDESGAELEKTKSKHHPILLGSKSFIPGFEENLIGVSAGEKKEFEVTFPADYPQKDFQKKKVKFEVSVHDIFEKIIPKFDDKIAAEIFGEKFTAKKAEEEMETILKSEKEKSARISAENEFLENLAAVTKTEVPPSLIEKEIDRQMQVLQNQLTARGANLQTHLQNLKTDEKKLREDFRPAAKKNSKISLVFGKFLDTQKVEISDAEIETKIATEIAGLPDRADAEKFFKSGAGRREVENQLRIEKFFAQLFAEKK